MSQLDPGGRFNVRRTITMPAPMPKMPELPPGCKWKVARAFHGHSDWQLRVSVVDDVDTGYEVIGSGVNVRDADTEFAMVTQIVVTAKRLMVDITRELLMTQVVGRDWNEK